MSMPSDQYEYFEKPLPSVLDEVARVNPEKIFLSYPKTNNLDDGFNDITNRQLLYAVDACAWWLEGLLGKSETFETLSYVGVDDARYSVFFYACVKAGYKVLLFSPKNAAHQNVSLLRQTRASNVFYSEKYKPLAHELSETMRPEKLSIHYLDRFGTWLSAFKKPYPYTKSFAEARFDPVVIFHSSGSTGDPKPITQNHQFFINLYKPPRKVKGRVNGGFGLWNFSKPGFALATFPPFHLAGFNNQCITSIMYKNLSIVTGFPDRPATAEVILQILRQKKVRLLYSPPSLIEGLQQIEGAGECLRELDNVIYAGGPLSQPLGDMLVQHTQLSSLFGSTEICAIPCFVPKAEDWSYFEFHPDVRMRWEPMIDGAFELVVEQDPENKQLFGGDATILRDEKEYRTKDLFLPHPDNNNLWRFFGRTDDIIIFSTGQKWNPIPSERLISTHTDISGCVVAGTGQFQPALLVEPKDGDFVESQLTDSLWDLIEHANSQTQRFGRIVRSKVAVVPAGSFLRTPKGTISRKRTLQALQSTIEDLYSKSDGEIGDYGIQLCRSDVQTTEDFVSLVGRLVAKVRHGKPIDNDTDLFAAGMDSLEALELSKVISKSLSTVFVQDHLKFIRSPLIFNHSTISRLADTLHSRLIEGKEDKSRDITNAEMASKHVHDLNIQRFEGTRSESSRVAITGTTGSLGSYVLERYLNDAKTTRILCLNRDPSGRDRTQALLTHVSPSLWSKVDFLQFHPGRDGLGLSSEDRAAITDTAAIIHCAWKVNFNQGLSSFEQQCRGVADLVEIAARSSSTLLFFVSSISATSGYAWEQAQEVPETVCAGEPDNSATTGYGRSKSVAERILAEAATRHDVPVTILRVGQIAGPDMVNVADPNGNTSTVEQPDKRVWNKDEWVPLLLKTSLSLGLLPSDLPQPVDWIPTNRLADMLTDIIAHGRRCQDLALKVYNLVNPRETTWAELLPSIIRALPGGSECQLVPFQEWLDTLRQRDSDSRENLDSFPALKILPFLAAMSGQTDVIESRENATKSRPSRAKVARFATENGLAASKTMAGLQAITGQQMAHWIRQWQEVGVFDRLLK